MDDTINATQMLEIIIDRLLDRLLGTVLDTENSALVGSIRRLEERVAELEKRLNKGPISPKPIDSERYEILPTQSSAEPICEDLDRCPDCSLSERIRNPSCFNVSHQMWNRKKDRGIL